MATVQLVEVTDRAARVRKDDEPPVEMTWGMLHEAQQQDGPAGYVYRWLMHEYCRCEYEQRQGRPWQSPRRDVAEIVAGLQARDAREAAEADGARRERLARQDAERRRRERQEETWRVNAERARTDADDPWWPVPEWEVPPGVRFDTPGRNQGQIVEVMYGTFGRGEAGSCDPYMLIVDHSDRSRRCYKRRRGEGKDGG